MNCKYRDDLDADYRLLFPSERTEPHGVTPKIVRAPKNASYDGFRNADEIVQLLILFVFLIPVVILVAILFHHISPGVVLLWIIAILTLFILVLLVTDVETRTFLCAIMEFFIHVCNFLEILACIVFIF